MTQGDRTRLKKIYPSYRQREIVVSYDAINNIILSGSGMGDQNAAYVVMSLTSSLQNARQLTAGQGLVLTDNGPNSSTVFSIDPTIVATTTGAIFFSLTGSLQQISPGVPYLVGRGSVSITTQSNGQIIISGSAGSGGGGSTVQTGANYGTFLDVPAYSLKPSLKNRFFTRVAMLEFDPSIFRSDGGGTRTIKFRFVGETTGPLLSAYLYNVGTNSIVSGTSLTISSVIPLFTQSADLTSNLSTGSALYEVHAKMDAGLDTDFITCDFASLRVEWT